jgi:PKD repeat protein
MRNLFLLIFLLTVAFAGRVSAQCQSAGFTMPDSVCSGSSFQVTNTSTPGQNYFWDLCPGEMKNIPTGLNLGADPNLNFPQQNRLIKENGNYYLFVVNFFGNSLIRYDYGTSLDNTPVAYNYTGLTTLNWPIGLDVTQENGTWYALVANYNSLRISRVNLGTVISNNTASDFDLGQFGLNGPRSIEIAFDGTNYFAFITNDGSSDLTKIEFGNSLTNNPSTFTAINNSLFNFLWGFDIKYDCSLSKWIALTTSYNLSQMHVLDFGSSLANAPVVSGSYNTLINPSGLDVVRDGKAWYAVLLSAGELKVQNLELNNNLLSTPVQVYADVLGSPNNPRFITILKDSSVIKAFFTNGSGSISKIDWNSSCTATPIYSTDPTGFTALINGAGYQPVMLEVVDPNGISSFYIDSIYLSPTPTVDFSFSEGCEGLPVNFSDLSTIAGGSISSWQWDFGDSSPIDNAQNPVHQFTGTGSFLVTLTAVSSSGCTSLDTSTITINPLPIADFTFSNNQCQNTPVSFSDQSQAFGGNTIVSYTWNFGDSSALANVQNPVHVFDSSGTFTVVLTVVTDAGCTDSVSQQITIIPAPLASFSVTSTCAGEIAEFTNASFVQGGGIINYNWNFGDLGTSTLQDPVHSYANTPMNYDVQLIADANGCVDTSILNIRISSKPIPQFTWNPNIVCQGNSVSFLSSSTGTSDTISVFMWDFGDSGTSLLENPVHIYADTGFYSVTLTVVSPTYCDSSITQQVYVIPGPTASFTANQACLNQLTSFSPQTVTPPGTTIDSIAWTFGDGGIFSGLSSPTHQYNAPGTYVVTMTVYNNLLCTAVFTDSVEVFPLPAAAFTSGLPCSGSQITFDGTVSTVTNDVITGWLWNFSGFGSSTDSIPTFAFSDSGTYNITLIVTTAHGCTNTISEPLTVVQSPDFTFTFNSPCEGSPVQFNFVSNTLPPPPASPTWDFGDGNSSSIFNPSHLFQGSGNVPVSLTIFNSTTGCSAEVIQNITIKPLPVAGFQAAPTCEFIPLQFTDTSSVVSGSINSWQWDLGSAGISSLQNPQVTFTQAGTLPVNLTVISDAGCSATYSGQVIIFPKPEASFISDPLFGSPPLTVNFTNTSTGINTYTWNFGDNTAGTDVHPSHIYSDTGQYHIQLFASSNDGCLDTAYYDLAVLVPFMDLAIQKIYTTVDQDQMRLSADISNQGNLTITSFVIKGTIENGSVITENYTDTLLPGQTINYSFNSSYQVDPLNIPGFYCIEALYPNDGEDQRPYNNGKCSSIDNNFEIFTAFPNPFTDQFAINFNLPFSDLYNVEIYDKAGKLVYEEKNLTGYKGYNNKSIYTPTFNKGIYACVIRFRDEVRFARLLKL